MLLVTLIIVGLVVGSWQLAHRSSPLVRRWAPSGFTRRTAGPLSVLDSGPTPRGADEVVVLLHGLGATGKYFGAFYDGLSRDRRVVIVDLLGFGHSLDEERRDFEVDDHVAALDQALDALGLAGADVVLAAHSMSATIALSWADRNLVRAQHVYLWGPPIYPDAEAAEAVGKQHGVLGRLFLLDSNWAERVCRFSCDNRELSGQLIALTAPRWPTPVSHAAARHTWAAYHGSLRALILDVDWSEVLPASVPVTIFHGDDDPIGDPSYISELVGRAELTVVPGADHHVALQRPELLFDALRRRPAQRRQTPDVE